MPTASNIEWTDSTLDRTPPPCPSLRRCGDSTCAENLQKEEV